jgi:hypothetical protein
MGAKRKKSFPKKIKNFVLHYPPEFSIEFKRYIRERDGYLCSNPACRRKLRLDVHHIDYNRYNTTKENCISLCRNCHVMIHQSSWAAKHTWKNTLWEIAAKRERQNGKKR